MLQRRQQAHHRQSSREPAASVGRPALARRHSSAAVELRSSRPSAAGAAAAADSEYVSNRYAGSRGSSGENTAVGPSAAPAVGASRGAHHPRAQVPLVSGDSGFRSFDKKGVADSPSSSASPSAGLRRGGILACFGGGHGARRQKQGDGRRLSFCRGATTDPRQLFSRRGSWTSSTPVGTGSFNSTVAFPAGEKETLENSRAKCPPLFKVKSWRIRGGLPLSPVAADAFTGGDASTDCSKENSATRGRDGGEMISDEKDDDHFLSAYEGDDDEFEQLLCACNAGLNPPAAPTAPPVAAPCSCRRACHFVTYDPEFPLRLKGNLTANSYDERLEIARSFCGHWVTVLEHSESMDAQYRLMGVSLMKRTILNRLALPMTFFLEAENTVLHGWLHTPIGIRHMTSNLVGGLSVDVDPDAGRWEGRTNAVDWNVPGVCASAPVRAMQQVRTSDKVGTSIETRCILPPDSGFGSEKIMYYLFEMVPKSSKGAEAKISALRILKFVHNSVPDMSVR